MPVWAPPPFPSLVTWPLDLRVFLTNTLTLLHSVFSACSWEEGGHSPLEVQARACTQGKIMTCVELTVLIANCTHGGFQHPFAPLMDILKGFSSKRSKLPSRERSSVSRRSEANTCDFLFAYFSKRFVEPWKDAQKALRGNVLFFFDAHAVLIVPFECFFHKRAVL